MKDRIRQIMKYKNMLQQEFAKKIDTPASTLSGIFKGNTQPSTKVLSAILEAFPEVSSEWLFRGKGNMFLHDLEEAAPNSKTAPNIVCDQEVPNGSSATSLAASPTGTTAFSGEMFAQETSNSYSSLPLEAQYQGGFFATHQQGQPPASHASVPDNGTRQIYSSDGTSSPTHHRSFQQQSQEHRQTMTTPIAPPATASAASHSLFEQPILNPALPQSAMIAAPKPKVIQEIRVFYDDGTYESFIPGNKNI